MPVNAPCITATPARLGWVPEPRNRGTAGIIWSCLLVLFVCTWSVMHHNLPRKDEGFSTTFWRKLRWATLAITAPELLTLFAIMQWNAARRSIRDMHNLGIRDWTETHAFYANAGGFVLEAPDCPPFPINATSISYLISKGKLEMPRTTEREIWDRSKADRCAKWVAVIQTGWLFCNIVVRAIQRLPVTPLELFTMAFVVPTLATQYFWWRKAQNAETPIHLRVEWDIRDMLCEAGPDAAVPYIDTPMDFVEKPVWDGWKRRLRLLHFGGLQERPLTRIPNDYSPPPTGKEAAFIWIISVVHAGIHCLATLTLLGVMILGGLVPVLSTSSWFDFTFNLLWIWVREAKKKTLLREWTFSSLVSCAYILYIAARLVILAEVISVFRSLPAAAYRQVSWMALWPHVG
ncbi:hypothetical protein BDV96DRAFT_617543 [Lophiotrema nucula]|uniref:Uncharacterized protein n=1 Tax=Lophiotrema nucula TaxID=690887 RepID=A0A6A5YFI6_9PLEO|nr:hypothetical protein BDV96DRAFT_617543 [Lophiotrema nucula]